MSRPDDKSLRAILKRVIGNLGSKFPEETKPVRPIRPHENAVTMFRLDDDFGWPTRQTRNDIHMNIRIAGELLKEKIIYRSFIPLGDMSIRLMLTRDGFEIDLREKATMTISHEYHIPFKHFRCEDLTSKQTEADRLMEELENEGFFFKDREDALYALDYILSTWIEETSAPKIVCNEGPEPRSFD